MNASLLKLTAVCIHLARQVREEDWVLVEGADTPVEAIKKAPDTDLLLRLLGERMLDKGDIFVEVCWTQKKRAALMSHARKERVVWEGKKSKRSATAIMLVSCAHGDVMSLAHGLLFVLPFLFSFQHVSENAALLAHGLLSILLFGGSF